MECRLELLEILTPLHLVLQAKKVQMESCVLSEQKNFHFTSVGQLYWLFALHKNSVCFRYLLLVQNVVHQVYL